MSEIRVGSVWISPKTDASFHLSDEVSDDDVREHLTRVDFGGAFGVAPHVALSFGSVDFSATYNCAVQVARVDRSGFYVRVLTSHQCVVYGVQVSWIAFATDVASFQAGIVKRYVGDGVLEPLSVGTGMRRLTTTVRFPVAFASDVKLFLALTGLHGADDLKVSCLATKLTCDSFELVINAWGDTHLQQVAVMWFAYREELEAATSGCRVLTGIAKFGKDRPGFTCHAGPPGPRSFDFAALSLDAPSTAKSKPAAISAVLGLAVNANEADVRLKTVINATSARAASLSLGTWSDTKVESGMLMWLAVYDLPAAPLPKPAAAPVAKAPPAKRPAAVAVAADDDDDDDDSSGDSEPKKTKKKAPPKKVAKKAVPVAAAASDDGDDDGAEVAESAPAKAAPPPLAKSASVKKAASKASVADASTSAAPPVPAVATATTASAAGAPVAAAAPTSECCICFDAPIDAVFVPCGHQACCIACATLLAPRKGSMSRSACPICSAKIDMVVKTFIV
jgi:hypothetical protein